MRAHLLDGRRTLAGDAPSAAGGVMPHRPGAATTPAALTVLGHLSITPERQRDRLPSAGRLSIEVPTLSKVALGCLAVGIGAEGGEAVAALAAAPWIAHLRPTVQEPRHGFAPEAVTMLDEVLGRIPGLQVASVALPRQPDRAEVDVACGVARAIQPRGTFVVATVSEPSRMAMVSLGEVFDGVIDGDGSLHHHWYPARTMTEPPDGRPICYDLYDVCSLWAGRLGAFGALIPDADALHVEVSAEVEAVAEVDRFVSATAAGLDDPGRLRLASVVAGARRGATAVSFLGHSLIRQDRAVGRDRNRGE